MNYIPFAAVSFSELAPSERVLIEPCSDQPLQNITCGLNPSSIIAVLKVSSPTIQYPHIVVLRFSPPTCCKQKDCIVTGQRRGNKCNAKLQFLVNA